MSLVTGEPPTSSAPPRAPRPVPPRRRRSRGLMVWLIPPTISLTLRAILELDLLNLFEAVGIAIAVPLIIVLHRRGGLVLRLFLIILPIQLLITSWLYEIGVSGGLVRMLGLWKELAAFALLIGGWAAATRAGRSLDRVDALVLGLASLGTAYLLLPELFVGSPGSELSMDLRLIAWRVDVLPALIFLGARHIRLDSVQLERIRRTVTAVAIAMGVIGVVEFVASDWWNSFAIDTLGVNRFRVEILQIDLTSVGIAMDEVRTYGEVAGREIVRIGGPMVSYLTFSFFLLVVGGVLLERVVGDRHDVAAVLAVCLVGAALLFTQTRSSLVGAVILVTVVLLPGPGRSAESRVRFTFLAVVVMALVVPVAFGSGLADRFTEGDAGSDDVHEARFDLAVDNVRENPVGLGLGTIGNRGRGGELVDVAENQFLNMGLQLGWLGMALFTAMYAAIIRVLRRAAQRARGVAEKRMAMGVSNALIALIVPSWYLQPFSVHEVGWVVLGLAGAALGAAERSAHDDATPLADA